MAPPPSATEEPEQVEALPMHVLSVASPAPEPAVTANGADASTAIGEPVREVAPAKAPKAGPNAPSEVDSALRDGLVCQKTRGIVLKFEALVEELVADESQQEMKFDISLTGYQRLLAHRVAQYYGLETSTVEGEDPDKGKIKAAKTPHTRAPKVRLAELKLGEVVACEAATPVEAPKLLRKKSGQHIGRHGLGNGDISRIHVAVTRTPTERRQDYERTKERIFSASGDAALQANGCGRGGSLDASEGGAERLGFGGGRGRGSAGAGAGGKALLRNRDEERCDPDFQRDPSRFQQQFSPGFGEQPGLRQGAYAPARSYSSEFPHMSAGMAATSGTQHAPGAQLGGQLPQSIGVAHGGGHYASNGQRSGYGGGSGGSGPPRFAGALRQNGGLAPMMAVPEGYMSAMPAHAAMGGVPGYPPLQLPYALLPGQGMPAMQGYGVYAPGGVALSGVPMMPAPGMGYAYLHPQRPGADGHPLSPMAHAGPLGGQALGPQALAPMPGMALPPGAIPMAFPGYGPGGYGMPVHMMQGLPLAPAPRTRVPARPSAPARRSNPGPGLQRHQRTNSGGSSTSTSTATSLRPGPATPAAAAEAPAEVTKPAAAAAAPEPPASAGSADN